MAKKKKSQQRRRLHLPIPARSVSSIEDPSLEGKASTLAGRVSSDNRYKNSMAISFEAILQSRTFKFLIGDDEVPFTVHEAAFADLSPELDTLMRGRKDMKMNESLEGKAKWEDVDPDTFMRFTQFAYTGDYSVPKMILGMGEEIPPPAPEPEPGLEIYGNNNQYWTETQRTFHTLNYTLHPKSRFAHTCEPSVEGGPNEEENIAAILLLHVSLYALAHRQGVTSLQNLALSKLHQTLQMLPPSDVGRDKRVQDLATLLRYTYSDGITGDYVVEGKMDDLRELVVQYVVLNAQATAHDRDFLELIEGGAIVRDIWKLAAPGVVVS
ncbi:hypothetical protein AJ79_06248 [Helicocarpus griseus UAMH5409]|uniref:BTB domain-containing protein n=1 Tax=Helicocarpus griseus UAMH5409 TaxID=1447875 RepID=A0A2B7XFH8_9EURO|nr:hypothetical protein AJ79_06248 [Helicocarpus griseus UAMH5409]